jgi:hypothetical protein
VLIPIVPSVAKRRRGHAAGPIRVGGVDLMDLGGIFGVARGSVGGDGCVVHLGLAVVLGDDREGRVYGRGGRVDEVGGEIEGLTGICTAGVNNEMGAVMLLEIILARTPHFASRVVARIFSLTSVDARVSDEVGASAEFASARGALKGRFFGRGRGGGRRGRWFFGVVSGGGGLGDRGLDVAHKRVGRSGRVDGDGVHHRRSRSGERE